MSDSKEWSHESKDHVLLEILDGRLSVSEACRRHRITKAEMERWVVERLEAGSAPLLAVWMLATSFSNRNPSHAAIERIGSLPSNVIDLARERRALAERAA